MKHCFVCCVHRLYVHTHTHTHTHLYVHRSTCRSCDVQFKVFELACLVVRLCITVFTFPEFVLGLHFPFKLGLEGLVVVMDPVNDSGRIKSAGILDYCHCQIVQTLYTMEPCIGRTARLGTRIIANVATHHLGNVESLYHVCRDFVRCIHHHIINKPATQHCQDTLLQVHERQSRPDHLVPCNVSKDADNQVITPLFMTKTSNKQHECVREGRVFMDNRKKDGEATCVAKQQAGKTLVGEACCLFRWVGNDCAQTQRETIKRSSLSLSLSLLI